MIFLLYESQIYYNHHYLLLQHAWMFNSTRHLFWRAIRITGSKSTLSHSREKWNQYCNQGQLHLADMTSYTGVGESWFPPCSLPSLFVTFSTSLIYLIYSTLQFQLYLQGILYCFLCQSLLSNNSTYQIWLTFSWVAPSLTWHQPSFILIKQAPPPPLSLIGAQFAPSVSGLPDYLIKGFLTLPIVLLFTPLLL